MTGLLTFLRRNQAARKIFGERELKIIEKQAWAVDLTQSEKNRLSRDIRKKLEFIKDASHFADEFKLKKGAALKSQINEILEVIKEDPLFKKINTIWLFGSTVEKKRALRSDIDIAVQFDHVASNEAAVFRKRILANFDKHVDVQVYNELPENVKTEVQKGKILYERKN